MASEYEVTEWCGCIHTRVLVEALEHAIDALQEHDPAEALELLSEAIVEHNKAGRAYNAKVLGR